MLRFVQNDKVMFFTYDQESELFLKRKDFLLFLYYKGSKVGIRQRIDEACVLNGFICGVASTGSATVYENYFYAQPPCMKIIFMLFCFIF